MKRAKSTSTATSWFSVYCQPAPGFIYPLEGLPIKGGMTIPVIATFDHGTHGCWFQVFFCHVHPPLKKREMNLRFHEVDS